MFGANIGVLSMVHNDAGKSKIGDGKQNTWGRNTDHDTDPERGWSTTYTPRSHHGGRVSLAERSSIGILPARRRFNTEEDASMRRQNSDSNDEEYDKKRRLNTTKPSLSYLLHIKFAFQISNTIYETLFAQHLQQRLQATPEQLGWMMSTIGLQAAFVNGLVVPRLISNERNSNWVLLIVCCLGQTAGTVLWALALSIHSSFAGAVIIALCSNIFLSILQGMLGSAPQVGGAGSKKGGRRGTKKDVNSGMTYGLSTVMDRGARSLAPLLAAASLQTHLHVPTSLFNLIGRLGPGPGTLSGLELSSEEAEALSIVHANEVLGLALVCAISGFYTMCLLASWYVTSSGTGVSGKRWMRLPPRVSTTQPSTSSPSGQSGYPTTP